MGQVKVMSADEFMSTNDIQKEFLDLTSYGYPGGVWIFGLTAKERDAFEETMIETKGRNTTERNLKNLRARLCARCIRDENGKRLFKGPEQVEALGNKSARALEKIFNVSRRLSGMTEEDVEELIKN